MPEPTNNIEQVIRDNAAGPKRAQGDAGSVEQHSLKDQVEADRYLSSKQVAANPAKAVRFTRLVPPGAGGN